MRSDKYCDYYSCKNYKQKNKELCYVHKKKENVIKPKFYPLKYKIFSMVVVFLLYCLFFYYKLETYQLFEKNFKLLQENKELVDYARSTYKDMYTLLVELNKYIVINVTNYKALKFTS